MSKDNDITVEQVRAVAEQYARENKISIFDVTARIVKDLLKRGSDGYIGAHLQTVKLEAAHAQLFGEKQISQQLMAAIYDELKRFTDNSREVAISEAAVTQQMFDELCERNIELEEVLDSKSQQLTEQLIAHTEKTRQLETERHKAQMEKNAIETLHNSNVQSNDQVQRTLGEAQVELGALKAQLDQFATQRIEQGEVAMELKEELKLVKQEKDTAQDLRQKAEQCVEILTWKNAQFIEENEKLTDKLELAIERAAKAEAQLDVVKKPKAKTTQTNNKIAKT